MLPIYWLLNMSFKTTTEIINTYSLWPQNFTLENYKTIFDKIKEETLGSKTEDKDYIQDLADFTDWFVTCSLKDPSTRHIRDFL